MLSWYVMTIIIYFMLIVIGVRIVLDKISKNFRWNWDGIMTALSVSCIPILRLLIVIVMFYLAISDVKVVISYLDEEEDEE
jgi:hypothetical protein